MLAAEPAHGNGLHAAGAAIVTHHHPRHILQGVRELQGRKLLDLLGGNLLHRRRSGIHLLWLASVDVDLFKTLGTDAVPVALGPHPETTQPAKKQ